MKPLQISDTKGKMIIAPYSIEPKFNNWCIVELIDFTSKGDQSMSVLNLLFFLLSC